MKCYICLNPKKYPTFKCSPDQQSIERMGQQITDHLLIKSNVWWMLCFLLGLRDNWPMKCFFGKLAFSKQPRFPGVSPANIKIREEEAIQQLIIDQKQHAINIQEQQALYICEEKRQAREKTRVDAHESQIEEAGLKLNKLRDEEDSRETVKKDVASKIQDLKTTLGAGVQSAQFKLGTLTKLLAELEAADIAAEDGREVEKEKLHDIMDEFYIPAEPQPIIKMPEDTSDKDEQMVDTEKHPVVMAPETAMNINAVFGEDDEDYESEEEQVIEPTTDAIMRADVLNILNHSGMSFYNLGSSAELIITVMQAITRLSQSDHSMLSTASSAELAGMLQVGISHMLVQNNIAEFPADASQNNKRKRDSATPNVRHAGKRPRKTFCVPKADAEQQEGSDIETGSSSDDNIM
jgi:hypothetical protein